MDRLAEETIRRYEQMDLSDLLDLSRRSGYAEAGSKGDYDISVTCLPDDPKKKDAVRILASVNVRSSLLSFMFPRTKSTLVAA